MRRAIYIILFSGVLGATLWLAATSQPEKLPDDYVSFTLHRVNGKFEGESRSELLGGYVFKISIVIGEDDIGQYFNEEALINLVRLGGITGTLAAPDSGISDISYEIVDHRGKDEIYMKSAFGYVLWEYLEVDATKMNVAFYFWYTPPASKSDIEIIEMAEDLLADENNWHKKDDRVCANDIEENHWSLFCALGYSSFTKAGEYNHHNTAIQSARFIIDELVPNHGYEHTLTDYNNAKSTTHADILQVLSEAKERVSLELSLSSLSN